MSGKSTQLLCRGALVTIRRAAEDPHYWTAAAETQKRSSCECISADGTRFDDGSVATGMPRRFPPPNSDASPVSSIKHRLSVSSFDCRQEGSVAPAIRGCQGSDVQGCACDGGWVSGERMDIGECEVSSRTEWRRQRRREGHKKTDVRISCSRSAQLALSWQSSQTTITGEQPAGSTRLT